MTLQDFLRLLLEDWVPAVFTVAVGGYLGSIYFPKCASSYQVNKQRAE
jgi:hypothetical protein